MNTYTVTYRKGQTPGTTYATVVGNTTHVMRVRNSTIPNATARGGIGYEAFTVTARGHKFTERTRKAAVAAAVASLRARGFDI